MGIHQLHEEGHGISALLLQAGGYGQESGHELASPFRLDAQTQLASDHRSPEGSF